MATGTYDHHDHEYYCPGERNHGPDKQRSVENGHSSHHARHIGWTKPERRRAQSSNLLIVSGALDVIDAGDGVARRLAKAGINIPEIGTIFLIHHHDDHSARLGTLMSVAWDQQRTKPINVYGPPRTEELVKAAVQYFTISAEIRIADGRSDGVLTRLKDETDSISGTT